MQTTRASRNPDGSGLAVVPPRSEEAIGRSALRKAGVRLLPLIGLGYGIAFMDRVNISFAALQMNRDLHFSETVFGLGAGLFFLSYAACEIPSNLLLVRFGARRWLARIMLTWGLISMAMMLVRTPAEFYAGRLLLGAAEAGFFPGVIFYLVRWFPAGERSKAISRFYISFPLSTVVMGGLAGWLLHQDGRLHLAGWQWLLLAEGLPAVAMSAAFLLGLPDGPAKAEWLTESEREWIATRLASEPRRSAHSEHDLAPAFRDPRVWLLGGFNFFLLMAAYGYTFSAPQLVKQVTGLGATGTGLIIAGLGVLGVLSMLLNGWHSDKSGERRWHLVLPLLLIAAAYVAASSSTRPVVVLPALAVMFCGLTAVLAPFWTIPPEFLRGRSAAAGIATINTIGILGGFVGPSLMGLLTDWTGGFQRGLLVLAAPVLLSALLMELVHQYSVRQQVSAVAEATPVASTACGRLEQ
jgi:MFS transporter, ACS family, tartrate transporter